MVYFGLLKTISVALNINLKLPQIKVFLNLIVLVNRFLKGIVGNFFLSILCHVMFYYVLYSESLFVLIEIVFIKKLLSEIIHRSHFRYNAT